MVMKKFKRQTCEVYSRVCGYIRPISKWGPGKLQEHKNRKFFKFKKEDIKDK